MEKKLKKQKNRLCLRIIPIMLAAWLTIAGVFCATRLYMEKSNVQTNELANLSRAKQLLTVTGGDLDSVNYAFLENSHFVYDENGGDNPFDAQLVITDKKTNQVVADSAGAIAVKFSMKQGVESAHLVVGLLDYDVIRGALTDEQADTIAKWLNTQRDDNCFYELICTEFQLNISNIIPLKLKIVLVNGSDTRFLVEDDVASFDLSKNLIQDIEIYQGSELTRNTIPKDFILNEAYNKDYLSLLTREQRKQSTDIISIGALEYLFYAKEYIRYDNSSVNEEDDTWLLEYVKKVNLFNNCKSDLFVGVALIFGFFFTIAVILCVMIWRTVRTQIVQEQKRVDLTNALAHDIKTPLFVISGYAYSLKEDIDETERALYIDKIIEQTDEVNAIVHKMLHYSKLDSCVMTLNKTDFDLCELIEEVLKNYTALPDKKRIVFTHTGSNTIRADRELIKTLLQNLTDNAAQYALPDSEVRIGLQDAAFTIENQAEPLTKAELKQLWQPYFRKDKSRSRKGNGLGLAIVKSIVDLHGGKCSAEMNGSSLLFRIEI